MKNFKISRYYCYLYFSLPLIFFFFININKEFDIWFLLSHGRYVLENGFPTTDILSMHTDFSFVMQQWLTSVIFYIIYHYLGNLIFYMFIFVINIVILYLLYKICMEISNNNIFASSIIASITDLFLEIFFISPRPSIFSMIIFLLLILFLEKYYKGNTKIIYFIPLLSILLVNLHSSVWFCLFIFTLPYIVEYIIKKDKKVIKLLLILVISFLIGFVNPYGIKAITYIFTSYGNKYINEIIVEMMPFNLLGTKNQISSSYLILLIFLSQISIMLLKNKKISIHHLLLLLGTFYMSLCNMRNLNFLLIISLPFISSYISIKHNNNKKIPYKLYITTIILIIVGFTYNVYNNNYVFKNTDNEGIIKYLNKNVNKDIKLYTSFNDGSYYEYYGYKSYIDGRAEVFLKKNNKKEDIFNEYYKLYIGKISLKKFTDKYKFDYLVVSYNDKLFRYLLKNDEYETVISEKYRILFKRKV